MLQQAQQRPTRRTDDAPGEPIRKGCRNQALASLAGSMRRRGMDAEEILVALTAVNQRRCQPPLSDRKVAAVARSIARYRPSAPLNGHPIVEPGAPEPPPPDSAILSTFLEACDPPLLHVRHWLEAKGVTPAVWRSLQVRMIPVNVLAGVQQHVEQQHGSGSFTEAGLTSLWCYDKAKVPVVVLPYYIDDLPVFVKCRPPMSKEIEPGGDLPQSINIGPPWHLYNARALQGAPGPLLLCERESDTLAALSHGYRAAGLPGKEIRREWVELFRPFVEVDEDWQEVFEERASILEYEAHLQRHDAEQRARELLGADRRSLVYLAFDGDAAGQQAADQAIRLFIEAGLPCPRRLALPEGQDLCDWLLENRKDKSDED